MKTSSGWKKFLRRGQSGQSIIVLAIGFIALLGFVGIVTDVSLMFVRYTGLRRAVDSAAIAAAGQMRTDRNLANVRFAATAYLEFHGVRADRVWVETCLTAPNDPQLCTGEARKLVRVIAQVDSPFVFMQVLGFRPIVLEASAISETAVMDIVMIIDVSESMLESTSLFNNTAQPGDYDYADIGMSFLYVPPVVTYGVGNGSNEWIARWQYLVRQRVSDASNVAAITNQSIAVPGGGTTTVLGGQTIRSQALSGATLQPREACRVRFYPNFSRQVETGHPTWAGYTAAMTAAAGPWPIYFTVGGQPTAYWDGYVPTFNFYGCCNDPGNGTVDGDGNITNPTSSNADGDFSDLICQPFKQARDAVRDFLERVDFARGDRVAIVTFNRSAYLMDPDGPNGPQDPMIEGQNTAINMLNRVVGVNAEPNFYVWDDGADRWGQFSGGLFDNDNNPDTPDVSIAIGDMSGYYNENLNNYPVFQNCYMMNAAQNYPFSPYTSGQLQIAPLTNIMLPPPGWNYSASDLPRSNFRSYELRAGCRDANIGAALREANNALNNPNTRRTVGAVWVVILISDGAAGASDPVLRNGVRPFAANPYAANPAGSNPGGNPPTGTWGIGGQYGSLGVCPYENFVDSARLPHCSDVSPETRQFCNFDPDNLVNNRSEPLDIGSAECMSVTNQGNPLYDVDDYARDWADWITWRGPLESGIRPTIFTIGFGITFEQGTGSCDDNADDCLGEELLRYIADVGDNYRVDTDYQQDYVNDGLRNFDASPDGFGPRGLCEGPGAPGDVARLTPTQSCGNYYNAPNQQELEEVFDDIASKMFTRIAS